ncbi:inositol hexakisphosphate kinase 3 [Rhizophlyctis rosea]|nr:inositol hexakisphosphate kinase 3 [Rhizophlyctis rosea]
MSIIPPSPTPTPVPTLATPASTFQHQLAGHPNTITLLPSGHLLKASSSREISFYKTAQSPSHASLKAFLPAFYGTKVTKGLDKEGKEKDVAVIEIEDLTAEYRNPCVMDIKLGRRLWSDDATEEKRLRMEEQARVTTSGQTGLRICGMKIYNPETDSYTTHDRTYGRSLTPQTLPTGIREFFLRSSSQTTSTSLQLVPLSVLRTIHTSINKLIQTIKDENVRLYTSSLLIIYEGNATDYSCQKAEIRLIDFAHAHFEDGIGCDDGAVFGLENLRGMVEDLIRESEAYA